MLGLALTIALQEPPAAAVLQPTAVSCLHASEQIENKLGVMLRAPTVLMAGMKKKDIDTLARIEVFKMKIRPLADAMIVKFPPRPRDQQPAPDPQIDGMSYATLFAFAQTCLDATL